MAPSYTSLPVQIHRRRLQHCTCINGSVKNETTTRLAGIVFVIIACATKFSTAEVDFQSRLTADIADVHIEFGLVLHHANTIVRTPSLKPPPGAYTKGTMVLAMFHSLENPGEYEIFTTNSSGNIPIPIRSALSKQTRAEGGDPGMCLYRWTTTDFQNYQGGNCTLWVPKDGLSDIKTMARDDSVGKYYTLFWGPSTANSGTAELFTSTNRGNSWTGPQPTDGIQFAVGNLHAKDDINFIYQPGVGLVDLQLFWQKNTPIPGGYCDNVETCDQRRVLGTLMASDDSGTTWNFTGSTRIPGADENDPPELQFYRCRPFLVPGTRGTRVFAHTLLYAPSPYINSKYGRQPIACKEDQPTHCHGPHMYEEWWTLAQNASAADLSGTSWRRPARFTKMAPENAYLFAQPGLVDQGSAMKMIWVGSGEIYTLPLHRGVGLYSPANARVQVQPSFDLSKVTAATRLWINADAKWGPPLPQGGCDETCAAYVLVELEDSNGKVIEGYDHASFDPIMDQDGINLPLSWRNSSKLPVGQANVTVKLWFRAAKVYAVYLGESFQPGF